MTVAPGRRIRGLEPEERRRERRRQLLESALELFSAQGYANTSIEQICQTAYVGFKGFYDEFATKEALFIALYDVLIRRLATSVLEALTMEGVNSLHGMIDAMVNDVVIDRKAAKVLYLESAGLSPTVEAHRRIMHRRFAEFVAETWNAGGFTEGVRPAETGPGGERQVRRRISLGVVGAITEIITDWLVDPDPDPVEQLVDDIEAYCRIMIAGVSASG